MKRIPLIKWVIKGGRGEVEGRGWGGIEWVRDYRDDISELVSWVVGEIGE